LNAFSPDLVRKPRSLVGSKTDLDGTAERLEILRKKYAPEKVLGISVFTGEGLSELAAAIGALADRLDSQPDNQGADSQRLSDAGEEAGQ
jgi:GTP-binding protein